MFIMMLLVQFVMAILGHVLQFQPVQIRICDGLISKTCLWSISNPTLKQCIHFCTCNDFSTFITL